jgi:hypothetical protein
VLAIALGCAALIKEELARRSAYRVMSANGARLITDPIAAHLVLSLRNAYPIQSQLRVKSLNS